jgi:hypothetical protein
VGLYDVTAESSTKVGWIVNWNPYPYLTAWSGQVWDDPIEGQTLMAMWHLTSEAPESSQWQPPLVGKDVFTRVKKSDEEVAAAMGSVAPSHPHREE